MQRRWAPWLSAEVDWLIVLKREVNKGDNAERNRFKRAFRAKALEDSEAYFNDIADEAAKALVQNNIKPV